ncbi:MAG: Mov34/MPN/PAD-1 family protein [Planctomycetota bacterium]
MTKEWRMPRAVHQTMVERAEAEYPFETCGLVFGADGALEVHAMENIQNRLHEEDPETHERDARTAYQFDTPTFLRVLEQKEAAGAPFRAIYHSHPDHKAYFSERDSEVAAPWGEPSYPGVVHLVYSVMRGKEADLKVFDWSADEEKFVEIPVVVED